MSETSYLIFKIQDSFCGIEAASVQEMIPLPELKRTADMHPLLVGLLNLRGEIIHAYDLNRCLNPLSTYTLNDCVVVIKTSHDLLGLIVSPPLNMAFLSELCPIDEKGDNLSIFFSKVAKLDDRIIFILESQVLREKIDEFVHKHPTEYPFEAPRLEFQQETQEILASRTHDLMKPLPKSKTTDSLISYLVVMLEEKYFGIEPNIIQEYFPLKEFTPLPHHAPAHLLGFFNFKGNALTLIDIWSLVDKDKLKFDENAYVLIINIDNLIFGIVVNVVIDFVYFSSQDLLPIPAMPKNPSIEAFGKHALLYQGNLLIALDFNKIFKAMHALH